MGALPPAVQTFKVEQLGAGSRQALLAIAARASHSSPIVARDNLGGDLAPIVVGLLVFGVNFATCSGPKDLPRVGFAGLVAALLAGWGVVRLRRRAASGLGTFMVPTEAYFVCADGADVVLYSWAAYLRTVLVDHRLNGLYTGTNVELYFGSYVLRIAAPSPDEATRLATDYLRFAEVARRAAEQGMWDKLEGASLVPF